LAGETTDADVGSQADDLPFMAAAGMWFSQAQNVAQLEVYRRRHGGVSSTVKRDS